MSPASVQALSFLGGLATTLFIGLAVPRIMKPTDPGDLDPPDGVTKEQWKRMTDIGDTARKPIRLIGGLEQALFYISFSLSAWELAGGWLVFKLGSKWEAWQAIVKVPEQPPNGVDAWGGSARRTVGLPKPCSGGYSEFS